MHKVRFAVAAAIAVALAGMSYLVSRQSTAQSYSETCAPSRIDAFALMVAAKNLPSERYDPHWLPGDLRYLAGSYPRF
jgi:hypothetical protein